MNRIVITTTEMMEIIQTKYDSKLTAKIWRHIYENGFLFNEFTLIWKEVHYTYKIKLVESTDAFAKFSEILGGKPGYKINIKKIVERKDHTHYNKKYDFEIMDYLTNLNTALEMLYKLGKTAIDMYFEDNDAEFIEKTWSANVLPAMAFMQYAVLKAMNREVVEMGVTQKRYKPVAERNYKPSNNKEYKLFDVIRKYEKHINHAQRHMTCDYWEVKGHFRHYKNGKVTYVKPYSKGKNKEGRLTDREYRL